MWRAVMCFKYFGPENSELRSVHLGTISDIVICEDPQLKYVNREA